MKECFRNNLGLNKANQERLEMLKGVIARYRAQGYTLTLRQLYYQLVTENIIPNRDSEYAKLSDLLVKARMAGELDWDDIEDRIRVPHIPYSVGGFSEALHELVGYYRLNRQTGQENYVEVWAEKDALSQILKRITDYYHIHLVTNRGYSSCTAMYDAYKRFYQAKYDGQKGIILYVGDHDPSGVDMVRDIRDRLAEFGVEPEVISVALTMEQIEEYHLPPNPAKIKDPRSKWYIEKYGNTSWEVDALKPQVLDQLVRDAVEERIDIALFDKVVEKEKQDKVKLQKIAQKEKKEKKE